MLPAHPSCQSPAPLSAFHLRQPPLHCVAHRAQQVARGRSVTVSLLPTKTRTTDGDTRLPAALDKNSPTTLPRTRLLQVGSGSVNNTCRRPIALQFVITSAAAVSSSLMVIRTSIHHSSVCVCVCVCVRACLVWSAACGVITTITEESRGRKSVIPKCSTKLSHQVTRPDCLTRVFCESAGKRQERLAKVSHKTYCKSG